MGHRTKARTRMGQKQFKFKLKYSSFYIDETKAAEVKVLLDGI